MEKIIIIKNQEQIDGIQKSCKLASETLDFAGSLISKDISTGEIDRLIESYIRDHGASPAPLNYHGFPKASCISINEVICHGIPSDDRFIQDGDIVNVDITTILDGYYGDTSKMFYRGVISDDASILLKTTLDCLHVGIAQVKPGNPFLLIGKAITEYARQNGYSVVHQFCGHGVGLEFHEQPQINHHFNILEELDQRIMEPGMIFTIEPMINIGKAEAIIDESDGWTARTIDGKLSAQYEHTILVTNEGNEILT